jgi:hypothetical protein
VRFNYVPADAINYVEMWQDATFDPAGMDRELALAQGVGFNCLRVCLQQAVWQAERDTCLRNLDRFLELCERRGLRAMLILFDDCAFSEQIPDLGPQPAVIPGFYSHARTRHPVTVWSVTGPPGRAWKPM